mgnify:CR=1 FL=1
MIARTYTTDSGFRVVVSAPESVIASLDRTVWPLYTIEAGTLDRPEHLRIEFDSFLAGSWALLTQEAKWTKYREGFTREVAIRRVERQLHTVLYEHQSGDFIEVDKRRTIPKVTIRSKNPAKAIRFVMLDSVSKWLQSRGAVCIHASAVSIEGRVVMFCGDKGAGKTTTALTMLKHCGEAAFVENDRVLWKDDTVFSGGTAISVLDRELGVKRKVVGKDALALLGQGVRWITSGQLGLIVILESGHRSIDIRDVPPSEYRSQVLRYMHDPWENWLGIFPSFDGEPNPRMVRTLRCQHKWRDEDEVVKSILEIMGDTFPCP